MQSKYPNTFYRVTVKGIIRDERGWVLAVKEYDSPHWSLPGGGMDHGETFEACLKREMYEEVLLDQPFTTNIVGVDAMFSESKQAYLMWIVTELTLDAPVIFGVGADASEAAFIDPKTLKNSPSRSERLVYKWCVDRTAAFE